MSADVRRRVEALERAGGAPEELGTLLVRFVRPGEPEGEVSRLCTKGGASFEREFTESEAAFIERAARSVRGDSAGPVLLFAGATLDHADAA